MLWHLEGDKAGQRYISFATGHTNMLMTLWVEGEYLFTASLDGHVKVWAVANDAASMQYDQVRACPSP